MYIDYAFCISRALHHSYTLEGTKINLSSSSKHESLINSCAKTFTVSQFYINECIPQSFLRFLPHRLLKELKLPTSLSKKMLTYFGLFF